MSVHLSLLCFWGETQYPHCLLEVYARKISVGTSYRLPNKETHYIGSDSHSREAPYTAKCMVDVTSAQEPVPNAFLGSAFRKPSSNLIKAAWRDV